MPVSGKCAEFRENGCKFILISSLRGRIPENYTGEANVRKQVQLVGRTRVLSYLGRQNELRACFWGRHHVRDVILSDGEFPCFYGFHIVDQKRSAGDFGNFSVDYEESCWTLLIPGV